MAFGAACHSTPGRAGNAPAAASIAAGIAAIRIANSLLPMLVMSDQL
jgi:hypothetical protein